MKSATKKTATTKRAVKSAPAKKKAAPKQRWDYADDHRAGQRREDRERTKEWEAGKKKR